MRVLRARPSASSRLAPPSVSREERRPPLRRRTTGGVATVGLLAAALLVPSGITADSGTGAPTLVATPATVEPGAMITIDGSGFDRRENGTVGLDAAALRSVPFQATRSGDFSVDLSIPPDAPAGLHAVVAGDGGGDIVTTTIEVVAAASSATPSATASPAATFIPTLSPTPAGTLSPTLAPTVRPTLAPTPSPTLAPTVRPTLAPTPAPTPIAYTFDDEFNGSSLAAVWGTAGHWSGLSEASISRSHTTVANGVMTITATRTSPNVWVSDTVDTFGRFSQTYGYFEARIRFTSGRGLWPAFWLAHDWTGDKSELDINETLANPYVAGNCDTSAGYYATVHLADGSTPAGSRCRLGATDLAGGWHTYAMDWRADHITFYLDGVAWSTYTGPIPTATMPIIFNLAVGGWAGASDSTTPSPSIMQVDWVRARA